MKQEAMATKTAKDIDRYAVQSCRVNGDSGSNGTQSRCHSSGKRQRCQLPSRSSSGGNGSDERLVMNFIQFLGQRQQGIEVAKAMRHGESNEKPGECRQPKLKNGIRLSRA